MRIFSKIYSRILAWSTHKFASLYLAIFSFLESAFFPIPPDVMLIPMAHAKPKKAIWYATITTLASAAGGIVGYIIGVYFFALIEPAIAYFGYTHAFERAVDWFQVWGVWAVLIAGITPIPYKVFTIGSGVVGLPFLPFVLASVIGRGLRFYVVAGLTVWGGERVERYYHKKLSRITS